MNLTLFKETNYHLSKLIEDIDMGEIGLPEIQRPFVWKNTKVRDLFDSMYKGFPVGYLLFWVNGLSDEHRQIGINKKQNVPRLLVVDGQQRLTSLYTVIKGMEILRENYRKEKISIAFNPLLEKFEVTDASIKRSPEWIQDISVVWSQETDIFELVDSFLENIGTSREITGDERKKIKNSIKKLHSLQNFPFTALELSQNVGEEDVSEVFVRINSKGTTLNQADFILTLMSVFWDEGRTELETFCHESRIPSTSHASPFNYFIQPDPDQVLRVNVGLGFRRARLQYVYLILRGKDLETEQFSDEKREEQFGVLKDAQSYVLNVQNWHDFFNAIKSAGCRRADMITSPLGLLYSYCFYLIGKRDFKVDSFALRKVIARWFFMSSMTARYSASPESAMEQDLAGLRNIQHASEFTQYLDGIIRDTLTEDYWNITLPNDLATSAARSPSLFAYYAALNLLDARGLFSNIKVSELLEAGIRAKKSALERHHLYPREYLKRIGITETRDINQIANYALVEWTDNIDISDQPPSDYVPKYLNRFNKDEIKAMYYCHALPESWETMQYEEFLIERRKKIALIVRDGFNKLQ